MSDENGELRFKPNNFNSGGASIVYLESRGLEMVDIRGDTA
jgi:hypothetical protein